MGGGSVGGGGWAGEEEEERTPLRTHRAATDPGPRPHMKTFQAYLPPGGRTYSCVHCRAQLANHDELISKVPTSPALPPYRGSR